MKKEKNASVSKTESTKKSSMMRFFLGVIIILGLGYVIFNYVPFIAKYDHYVIVTNSMEPVIMVGDVVIVDSSVTADEVDPGQIIAFYADINDDGTDEVVVHYLYTATEVEGVMIYKTKPEISDNPDPWELTADDILGAYKLTIPNIGPLLLFFSSTIGKAVLVIDVVIIYLLMEMFSSKKKDGSNKEGSPEENKEDSN